MKYYDISLNLSAETTRWITSPPFELMERRRMSRGDQNNSSALHMSVHAGTHLDAPFHFVPNGATIDSVPPKTAPKATAFLNYSDKIYHLNHF